MDWSIAFGNANIEVTASRAWFEQAHLRDARRWAEERGWMSVAAEPAQLQVSVPIEDWNALGVAPVERDPEREEQWAFGHEAVAALFRVGPEQVVVHAIGHVGGPRLRMLLSVNGEEIDLVGARPPRFSTTEQGPIVLSPLACALAARLAKFAESGRHTRAEQLVLIADLKRHAAWQGTLSQYASRLRILLDRHLESFEVIEPERFRLCWDDDGRNRISLKLFVEGEADPLPLESIDERSAVIDRQGRQAIILDAGTEIVARKASAYQHVRRDKVEPDLLRDPIALVPDGVETPRIDFSEYSHRVIGFEPAKRDPAAVVHSSGTTWYQKDEDGGERIVVTLVTAAGKHVQVGLDACGEAQEVSDRIERAARDGVPSVDVGGHQMRPSEDLPGRIRDLLRLHRSTEQPTAGQQGQEESRREPDPKTARLRAVLADVMNTSRSTAPPPPDLQSVVPWDRLSTVLAPGVALKSYQRDGIAWLWHRYTTGASGALLADDMGLGKTLQIACFVALAKAVPRTGRGKRPSLIVAPLVLIENWGRELSKFFVGSFPGRTKALFADGARGLSITKGALDRELIRTFDFVITSYDMLARYAVSMLGIDWDIVILDEAHKIKSRGTQWSVAARGLSGTEGTDRPRKFDFGICATGTPVENSVMDLWALYDFLSPGRPFAGFEEYRREYGAEEDAPDALAACLKIGSNVSSVLRREKVTVLRAELPPKTYESIKIPMTPFQHDQERVLVSRWGQERAGAFKILEQLQKLYQHPWLLGEEGTNGQVTAASAIAASPKLGECIRLLERIRARGEKVLVFTLWTRMQSLLRDVIGKQLELDEVHIVNGEPQNSKRAQERIQSFSGRPGFGVLILSPLAAGMGLNIVAANHVIHYGRWWNPAKEDQATDRAYRIGQVRPVSVYYPVLHHPHDPNAGFDVKLDELVAQKRDIARQLLEPADRRDVTDADLQSVRLGGA